MKILFISPHSHSFEQNKGGAEQRTYLIIKALTQFADVDFIAFHSAKGFDALPIKVLFEKEVGESKLTHSKLDKWLPVLKFGDLQMLFPENAAKMFIINDLVAKENYDFIVTRYIYKALEFGLLRYAKQIVVDADDSLEDFFKWQSRYSNSKSGKLRYGLLSLFSRAKTQKFVKEIHKITFASQEKAIFYKGDYLPNIPFYEKICSPINFSQAKKRIFFIGSLWYEPNYMGINYFLKNIYQKLVEKLPDVEFCIAGSMAGNEHLKTEWESYPNVKVLGFVENLQAEYEKSRVVVVPIYQGAGTNIKVVEALQMRRACVVSEFATRGFSAFFADGRDYFVAKNDNNFVETLEKLLTDEKLNSQVAENGCEKVQQHFSFAVFAEKVRAILN
ncbi:MAG: glycosyltransferase family 4 protein [Prevotellaceae bacterium]|jgi:glycosyltransferase involved in cell wall biosynthesis|nr:glycosyltransferase family 4 protein [Prevotellaceae bacterium]